MSLSNAPPSMIYNQRQVPAVEAISSMRRFDSSNGNLFSGGGANEARIPISANNGFLDTNKGYLQFTVTGAAAEFSIDFTAGSFIERIEIQNQGRTVWRGDRYSLYHNAKKAYNSDSGDVNKLAACEGNRGLVLYQGADHAAHSISPVTMSGVGKAVAAGDSKVYTLDLECGLLKNTLKKAIPQGANFDIVVRFRANNSAICAHTGAPTWTISDCRYYTPSYQIVSSEIMNMYSSMVAQGAVTWSGDYLKTYVNTTNAGAGPSTLQLNDRSLSVKGFLTILRLDTADTTLTTLSNSGFILHNTTGAVTSYEMNVGGNILPASGRIDLNVAADGENIGRAYNEALRTLCDEGKSESTSQVTAGQFLSDIVTIDANKTLANTAAKGVLALDCRKFDALSLTMTGLNTAASSAPNTMIIEHSSFGVALDATTYSICQGTWQLTPTGEITVSV